MLKRVLSDKSYWLCCICVFALCFTAMVGTSGNGEQLNVLSYIFGGEKNPPDVQRILKTCGGTWLFMFMPIISSLCFVNVICDDVSSGFLRFELLRTDFYKLKAAKFIFGVASSGICMLLGFIAYAVCILLYFPRYNFEIINLAEVLVQVFALGIVSAVPGLVTAAFTNNKYLIVCAPFVLRYYATQLATRITDIAYEDFNNPNPLLAQIGIMINPNSMGFVFSYPQPIGILSVNTLVLFCGFAIYYFKKGGADRGA